MVLDPRSMPLREMMDRLLNEAFILPRERMAAAIREGGARDSQMPPVNMYETDTDVMVILPLPGASPNDIQIDLLGNQLTVHTEARRDEPHAKVGPAGGSPAPGDRERRWYLHEFHIGPYHRTIELPYAVEPDSVQASFEHGILSLRCPRPQAKMPRRITVKPTQSEVGGATGSVQVQGGSSS